MVENTSSEANISSLIKNFPAYYEILKFLSCSQDPTYLFTLILIYQVKVPSSYFF